MRAENSHLFDNLYCIIANYIEICYNTERMKMNLSCCGKGVLKWKQQDAYVLNEVSGKWLSTTMTEVVSDVRCQRAQA